MAGAKSTMRSMDERAIQPIMGDNLDVEQNRSDGICMLLFVLHLGCICLQMKFMNRRNETMDLSRYTEQYRAMIMGDDLSDRQPSIDEVYRKI